MGVASWKDRNAAKKDTGMRNNTTHDITQQMYTSNLDEDAWGIFSDEPVAEGSA